MRSHSISNYQSQDSTQAALLGFHAVYTLLASPELSLAGDQMDRGSTTKDTGKPAETQDLMKNKLQKEKEQVDDAEFISFSVGAFLVPEQIPTLLVVLEKYSGNKMPRTLVIVPLNFPNMGNGEC